MNICQSPVVKPPYCLSRSLACSLTRTTKLPRPTNKNTRRLECERGTSKLRNITPQAPVSRWLNRERCWQVPETAPRSQPWRPPPPPATAKFPARSSIAQPPVRRWLFRRRQRRGIPSHVLAEATRRASKARTGGLLMRRPPPKSPPRLLLSTSADQSPRTLASLLTHRRHASCYQWPHAQRRKPHLRT